MKKKVSALLENIYGTVNHPASLSSAKKIRNELKKSYDINISHREVQEWLNEKRSYSLHKRALRHYERNPTVVSNLDDQWQIDLFFLPDLGGEKRIALLVIDLASRFVWVEPIRNKSGPEVSYAMRKILERANPRKPIKIQGDDGTEFFNKHFKQLMKEYDINLFSTRSDLKAAIAERVIRTIKEKIYRALDNDVKLGNNWIQILKPVVSSYNHTFHEAIQTSPAEVTNSTVGDALHSLYSKYWKKDRGWSSPKFNIGDYVRISINRQAFAKGYKGKWREELFQIYQIKYTLPNNMYKLQTFNGSEKIEGTFYEQELQKIKYSGDTKFQIDSLLKERVRNGKKEFLVRWAGYGEEEDTWLPEEEVVDV
jgi:transposase InsO family protein